MIIDNSVMAYYFLGHPAVCMCNLSNGRHQKTSLNEYVVHLRLKKRSLL